MTKNTSLPEQPDYKKIRELVMSMNYNVVKGNEVDRFEDDGK